MPSLKHNYAFAVQRLNSLVESSKDAVSLKPS